MDTQKIKEGTLVYVSDTCEKGALRDGYQRIYLREGAYGGHWCVAGGEEHSYMTGGKYDETFWMDAVPVVDASEVFPVHERALRDLQKGDYVYISDASNNEAVKDMVKRIFTGKAHNGTYTCVRGGQEEQYMNGEKVVLLNWKYAVPCPPPPKKPANKPELHGKSASQIIMDAIGYTPYPTLQPITVNDAIDPSHYNWRGGVATIDFLSSNDVNGAAWNICKYIYRHPERKGLEDCLKCKRYLLKMVENTHSTSSTVFVDEEFMLNILAYCASNKMTVLETKVITMACLGQYSKALEVLNVLLKEVYNYTEDGGTNQVKEDE